MAPLAAHAPSPRLVPPARGCVASAPQTLAGPLGRGVAVYFAGRPGVIASGREGRELTLFQPGKDGVLARGATLPLAASVQRISALCGERCELALIDQPGQLWSVELDGAGFSSPRLLAKGVDRRFAPALARAGDRTLYAYTSSVDETMHTQLVALVGGKPSTPRDLTPAGHGGAAPTFVLGSARTTLLFIDARAGYSPLLEIPFDDAGTPGEALVRTPVSQPYAPPLLAAVQWSSGEVEVFFTAIGRAAMTAVGRVSLRKASEPSALLPSKGYGERELSVARSGALALIAAETTGDENERTIALKLADGVETLDVPWPGKKGATRPSLAAGPVPGEFNLVYVHDEALATTRLACRLGAR